MNQLRIKESQNSLGNGICLYDFVMNAKFCDLDIPVDITDSIRKDMKDAHPSMIIGGGAISLNMYKVEYSYTTKRNNEKTSIKYIFLNESSNCDEEFGNEITVETELMNWVSTFNFSYPYKAISNVKILEIVPYANAQLAIG